MVNVFHINLLNLVIILNKRLTNLQKYIILNTVSLKYNSVKSLGGNDMFVGRLEELEILHRLLEKPSASAMIYGKRKVGKTTLIDKALKASADKKIISQNSQ